MIAARALMNPTAQAAYLELCLSLGRHMERFEMYNFCELLWQAATFVVARLSLRAIDANSP